MAYVEDHGLPLVQLKEQRRDLVVALSRRDRPVSSHEIAKIAALQQTIAAMEAIVDDLDSTIELASSRRPANEYLSDGDSKPIKLIFGRRKSLDLVSQHH
jgi:hypothetical protein